MPCTSVPWQQQALEQQALEISVNRESNPEILARQLTFALTCDSQEYTTKVDVLMLTARANAVAKTWTRKQFSTSFANGDLACIQLAGEQVRVRKYCRNGYWHVQVYYPRSSQANRRFGRLQRGEEFSLSSCPSSSESPLPSRPKSSAMGKR